MSYTNGSNFQIQINTTGTPVKIPYDPKQSENSMLKSQAVSRMDMSQTQNMTRMEDDMKMTASEMKNDNPMLASVNKSMFVSKEPDMAHSGMAHSGIGNGTTLGIILKIPDSKKEKIGK